MVPPLIPFLILSAFVLVLLSAINPPRVPLWVGCLIICLVLALMAWPK